MSIGLIGVAMSLTIGVVLGSLSGFYGGWVDLSIQRLIEVISAMPTIPLWLGLAAAVPLTWSPLRVYFVITLIVSLLAWTGLAREVRGRFFALRGEDFVTAARLDGSTERRVIFRHILPSLTSHILAVVTLAIPTMIVAETALSFLGVGLKPPVVSYGVLLQDAQNIRTDRDRALAPDLAVARRRHGGAQLQLHGRRAARRRRPVRALMGTKPNGRPTLVHPRTTGGGAGPLACATSRSTSTCARTSCTRSATSASTSCPATPSPSSARAAPARASPPARSCASSTARRASPAARSRSNIDGQTTEIDKLEPNSREIRAIRGRRIGLIFQEPMSSLSPVRTIGAQIIEAVRLHRKLDKRAARALTIDLLRQVEIQNPEAMVDRYTFEFSGGMRQRAMIAMALAGNPDILIADEPTTALDVTTQAEILDLIKRLQVSRGMAMLLITHDLGIVAEVADEVAVMRFGKIVEHGPVDDDLPRPEEPLRPRAARLDAEARASGRPRRSPPPRRCRSRCSRSAT